MQEQLYCYESESRNEPTRMGIPWRMRREAKFRHGNLVAEMMDGRCMGLGDARRTPIPAARRPAKKVGDFRLAAHCGR